MPSNDGPRLPGLSNRTVIVGTTGSGKSVAGADLLLRYRTDYPDFPWLIFNPKHDDLLDSIGAEQIDLTKDLPRRGLNGRLTIVHPVPESDDDEHVDKLINQSMALGNMGLYLDEGYSIPKNSKAFRRALTQGRSRNVPVITLSQRPVHLDKFVFTEASIYRVFYLVDDEDRKTIRGRTGIKIGDELPLYQSYWRDVARRSTWQLLPGPSPDMVREGFEALRPPKCKSFFHW